MRKLIVLCAVLTLAGCERATVGSPDFKTIMIQSVGEVETLPDQAEFHIALNCMDNSVKASKNCLVVKSNELVDKLQSFGIHKNDILTTSVNLDKSYTWRNNSNVFEGYRSSTSLIVTIKNIDKLDEIYTELLENMNLEIGGLSYTHSKLDSLQNAAYVMALKKSGTLADRLLTELPENKKEILKIGNVEITASMPTADKFERNYAVEEASTVANQSISINAGMVKVAATLYVEYQIK